MQIFSTLRNSALALLMLGLMPWSASSPVLSQQSASGSDTQAPFSFAHMIDYTILENGFVNATIRYRGKLNDASALQALGTYRETINEHYNDFAVLEAATIKPDGRRVPVDPTKILKQAAPAAAEALSFYVDVATYTLIFPELAVGDEVEAVYTLNQKKPFMTGGQSYAWSFPRNQRRSASNIRVNAPKSSNLRVWQAGLDHQWEEVGDRVIHRLAYAARPFASFQAGVVDSLDFEPHYMFSTFRDWRAVADEFWVRGAPKSDPTPEITALALKLTAGLPDEAAKAKAIFDWVSSNVRYVNIVLGAGGWVPRESGSILSNLYGDCKDHATLMRAMLRAVNIKSDYVLVNVAARYSAYPMPMGHFDHIILYLPGLGLYVDPTNRLGEFGAQDLPLADKPVLRFNGEEAVYTRIPKVAPEANSIILNAEIEIGADGKAKGNSSVKTMGSAAPLLRGGANRARNSGLEETATKAMNAQNWRGKARYVVEGAMGKLNPPEVKASFELDMNFLNAEDGGIRIPTGPRMFTRPHLDLLKAIREERKEPFICHPVRYEENIKIRLPDGLKLTKPPENVALSSAALRYEALYTFKDQALEIHRLFVWNPASPVCKISEIASARRVLGARARDINQARLNIDVPGKARKGEPKDDDSDN